MQLEYRGTEEVLVVSPRIPTMLSSQWRSSAGAALGGLLGLVLALGMQYLINKQAAK